MQEPPRLTRTVPIVVRVNINAGTTKRVGTRQGNRPYRNGLTQGTVQACLQGLQRVAHARGQFFGLGPGQERGRFAELFLFFV